METENVSVLIPDEVISNKIFLIREVKVMLDKDLSELYGVSTGNLNKAVKRNIKCFPDDFMFQLNKEEFEILKFQFGTSSFKMEVANCDLHFEFDKNISLIGAINVLKFSNLYDEGISLAIVALFEFITSKF